MATKRNGFTLIELLIVVVIIGILASIAIPKFSAPREKAFVSAMTADLRNLASHQDVYHNGNYTLLHRSGLARVRLFRRGDPRIGEATAQGWSASATHAGLSGVRARSTTAMPRRWVRRRSRA